ncbi:MAG TPA: CsgG/HfaB family protein [Methylomirabilota bacterium]|nr:CsgG/HfaB family protein [Methylomirabilota bacterium]
MRRRARIVLLVAGTLSLLGCASAVQEWVKPGAARIDRVAVLPFENQTTSLRAGQAAADLLVSQLLAAGTIAVMDPSEVADLLRRENLDPTDAARLPSAQRVGRLLRVSHVLQGSVTEYRYKPGLSETPAVGLTARLVDVASGEVVWTASHARLGSSWFREDGLARLAQRVTRDMAVHLTAALGDAGAR